MFTSPNFTTPNKVNNDNQGVTKEVHDAFLNLFKGPTNDNVIGGIMQTPSFFDNKHRIRAEPLNNKPSGETPNVQRDAASSRIRDPFVFSPIPNMPQSTCSIFGVRGENNPHSPFNNRGSNEKYTPKKSPITTEKILRQVAHAQNGQNQREGLGLFNQGSKMSGIGQRITPGQLLLNAQPQDYGTRGEDYSKIQSRGSPKNGGSSTYKLYQGKINTGFLQKFPAQPQNTKAQHVDNGSNHNFLKGITTTSPVPSKQHNVINIFTQQVSCSNFYQSCNGDSESKCANKRCE